MAAEAVATRRVVIQPGMVCYDDFVDEHYLTLSRNCDRDHRPRWHLLNLRTGEEIATLERMLLEDPDIGWL